MMTPVQRADCYNCAFPKRPPLSTFKPGPDPREQWVGGTWLIGACYKNPNPLYGAYPRGYLERVHSMFPDARSILHVFSGGLNTEYAIAAAWPGLAYRKLTDPAADQGYGLELVDLHGPDKGRYPTWQGNVHDLPAEWAGRFDLILADPPYSAADAAEYGTPMVNRAAVIRKLREVCAPGGNLVWLDQCWPQHRSDQWKCWAQIGLVRSTNHRMRLVSIFAAI